MITPDDLRAIAAWSRDLTQPEFEEARRGVSFRIYGKGSNICHVGDRLESWTGVAEGLVKMSTTSKTGKSATLAGMRAGAWFGEGTAENQAEPYPYPLLTRKDPELAVLPASDGVVPANVRAEIFLGGRRERHDSSHRPLGGRRRASLLDETPHSIPTS